MEESVEDPWRDNLARFVLDAASVTIMPTSGEMTARHGLRLSVEEGRQEELRDDERGRPAPSALAYFMRVGIADAPAPELVIGTDARVVISGRHRNGSMVMIAGPAWRAGTTRRGLRSSSRFRPRCPPSGPKTGMPDAGAARGH